jgi:hypothetical protein
MVSIKCRVSICFVINALSAISNGPHRDPIIVISFTTIRDNGIPSVSPVYVDLSTNVPPGMVSEMAMGKAGAEPVASMTISKLSLGNDVAIIISCVLDNDADEGFAKEKYTYYQVIFVQNHAHVIVIKCIVSHIWQRQ